MVLPFFASKTGGEHYGQKKLDEPAGKISFGRPIDSDLFSGSRFKKGAEQKW